MSDPPTIPPDGRLDGPIHGHFGLSYSNYQVLPRTLMQSMPVEWQKRMVACLEELSDAFAHIEQPAAYQVTPAVELTYCDLDEDQMGMLDVTVESHYGESEERYYDFDGNEHGPHDRVLVPCPGDDLIPHYDRGRTYIEPRAKRR